MEMAMAKKGGERQGEQKSPIILEMIDLPQFLARTNCRSQSALISLSLSIPSQSSISSLDHNNLVRLW